MKNYWIVIFLCSLFIGVSCQKEITPAIENNGALLITKEIYADDLYNEFTYNEQNLLKERKSKWFYTLYHYNVNNQVISTDMYEDPGIYSNNWETAEAAINRTEWVNPENTEISGKASYSYKNQILESITVLRIPGGVQNKSVFQYDDKGRIFNQVFYNEGKTAGNVAYTYDVDGNVTKEEHYSLGVLFATKLFEYDDKHNPFNVFKSLGTPGTYTNENNIVKETLMLMDNIPGVDSIQVTESTYQYNEQDYPVKKDNMIIYEYK